MAACLIAGAIGFGPAHAASLPDPTRPPASLNAGPEAAADSGEGLRLQSVLISPLRRVAIINGQMARVGDRIGNAELVRISEGEVVLRNGRESRTLRMFSEVEKRQLPARGAVKTGQ